MGVCPQQNVLFNNLTVLEHLKFFERIKGVSGSEVEDRAKEVGLGDFFHTKAGQLSGGNKRKLQLAIALAGEPKLGKKTLSTNRYFSTFDIELQRCLLFLLCYLYKKYLVLLDEPTR